MSQNREGGVSDQEVAFRGWHEIQRNLYADEAMKVSVAGQQKIQKLGIRVIGRCDSGTEHEAGGMRGSK